MYWEKVHYPLHKDVWSYLIFLKHKSSQWPNSRRSLGHSTQWGKQYYITPMWFCIQRNTVYHLGFFSLHDLCTKHRNIQEPPNQGENRLLLCHQASGHNKQVLFFLANKCGKYLTSTSPRFTHPVMFHIHLQVCAFLKKMYLLKVGSWRYLGQRTECILLAYKQECWLTKL